MNFIECEAKDTFKNLQFDLFEEKKHLTLKNLFKIKIIFFRQLFPRKSVQLLPIFDLNRENFIYFLLGANLTQF